MPKRYKPGYIPGDYYFLCQICGFKNRVSNMAITDTKLKVCRDSCFDPKYTFIKDRVIRSKRPINISPEPEDQFIDPSLPPNPDAL